jgi:hypothetical protein
MFILDPDPGSGSRIQGPKRHRVLIRNTGSVKQALDPNLKRGKDIKNYLLDPKGMPGGYMKLGCRKLMAEYQEVSDPFVNINVTNGNLHFTCKILGFKLYTLTLFTVCPLICFT